MPLILKTRKNTTGVQTTEATEQATIIQSRHRIPEVSLVEGQILVLQVPLPEPLRKYEPSEWETKDSTLKRNIAEHTLCCLNKL